MSSLYFFCGLGRLPVVSCFRVHWYKNVYQRNVQQSPINTYFVVISGCWADKSQGPSSRMLSDGAVSVRKSRGCRTEACMALPMLGRYAALREEPWPLTLGLLCCILGEWLSPLLPRPRWKYSIKMTQQNGDSGLATTGSFLLSGMTRFPRLVLGKPCPNSEINHFTKKPWFVFVRNGMSQPQCGC